MKKPRNSARSSKRLRVKPAATTEIPIASSEPSNPPKPTGERYTITLRFQVDEKVREEAFELDDRTLYPEAKRWNYVLRNRQRLSDSGRTESTARAVGRLADIFSGGNDNSATVDRLRSLLMDIARSEVVEVSLPDGMGESTGYATRVFPWEMVLTYLTGEYRASGQRLCVVRHLDRSAGGAWPQKNLKTLLAVSNAPGKIANDFNLVGECRLVAGILGLAPCGGADAPAVRENPTVADLEAMIAGGKPDIIHLAGIDPQYAEHYKYLAPRPTPSDLGASREATARDGLVLFHAVHTYDPLDPERLAALCNSKKHHATFVAISTCFSGRRVAAKIVEAGAEAAIGFQDTITDAAAEGFFSAFYRCWRESAWIHPALVLRDALSEATTDSTIDLTGGVVLWSRHSVFGKAGPAKVKPVRAYAPARSTAPVQLVPHRDLEVVFKTVGTLNYSLLHNQGSLFTEFRVRKQPGAFPDLSVEVALEAGGASLPCRFTCRLPEKGESVDLLKHISTPLLAPLLRQVSECMRSHVYVRVSCVFEGKKVVLLETTSPVTILPVDEWRDDGKDHCWLPSFVLPRDPAVLKITTAAQRYLRAIADDPQAGFSGYQGIDGANAVEVIEPQIRAIWAALQHEFRLTYINPPPSYTMQAQRLRTPSQILAGGAATCIDLALLFSACLEYIGIYSAIFLIQGHAFPAYWRDDASWLGLQEVITESEDVISDDTPALQASVAGGSATELGQKWMLSGAQRYPALASYVRARKLVPFESTFVTANRGFAEAQEQGRENLDPRTFDAMIDVGLARLRGGVTPLPILES